MAHETLAPWAEVVPGVRPMTVDDLLALPDDEWMYELVEGRLVRMPLSGGEASRIGVRLAAALLAYVEAHDLGAVTGADGEYDLTRPGDAGETALAPDVAFVRADRVPARDSADYKRAWRLAPDLAVEIASPNQYRGADPLSRSEEGRPGMAEKAGLYLAAGVRLVWVVWPKYQQVDVWQAGTNEPVTSLGPADMLDGLDVVPGFSYPIDRLFA